MCMRPSDQITCMQGMGWLNKLVKTPKVDRPSGPRKWNVAFTCWARAIAAIERCIEMCTNILSPSGPRKCNVAFTCWARAIAAIERCIEICTNFLSPPYSPSITFIFERYCCYISGLCNRMCKLLAPAPPCHYQSVTVSDQHVSPFLMYLLN
jgi:hypothetical protein